MLTLRFFAPPKTLCLAAVVALVMWRGHSAHAAAPLAMLTDVHGTVQVTHAGHAGAGGNGTQLFAGDRVRVVSGSATVFSMSAASQVVPAGKQVTVTAGGSVTQPKAVAHMLTYLSQSLTTRINKVPATMRPGALLPLAPINSKTNASPPVFTWSFGELAPEFRADYQLTIHDESGFAWSGTTKDTTFTYPAAAPALAAGHRYSWFVAPRDGEGEADNARATPECWFQIATTAELLQRKKDDAGLAAALQNSPDALLLSRASLLAASGFNDDAVALLLPQVDKPGAPRDTPQARLLCYILTTTARTADLVRLFPDMVELQNAVDTAGLTDVVLPLPQTAATELPPRGLKNYNDPGGAFKISLPVRWGATRFQMAPGVWYTGFAAQLGSKPDMAIVTATAKTMNGGKLADQLFNAFKKFGTFSVQGISDSTFAGQAAARTDWTLHAPNQMSIGYSLEFTRGDNVYVLSLSQLAPVPPATTAPTTGAPAAVAPAAPPLLFNGQAAGSPEAAADFALAQKVMATFATDNVGPQTAPPEKYPDLNAEIKTTMTLMGDTLKVEGSKTPAALPTTEPALLAAFDTIDVQRRTAAPASLEHADAAAQASRTATALAWTYWDGGNRVKARDWFDKRDSYQRESYNARCAYYEGAMDRTDRRMAQLAGATYDVALTAAASTALEGWHNLQISRNTILLDSAYNAGDSTRQMKYARRELALQQDELDNSVLATGLPNFMNARRMALARAIETVADAQEALGAYGKAAKSYLLSLAWRRALPPDFNGRELQTPMSRLGYLYMLTDDFPRAIDWYHQALAEMDAAATTRQAAIDGEKDPTLKDLLATDSAQGYAVTWNNLGLLTEDTGDLTGAENAYNKALQAMQPVSQDGFSGYMRASMMATSQGNIATLRADSGEIDEALRMATDVIATRRKLGDDSATAFWLFNRAGFLYQRDAKGDVDEARAGAEEALRLFQATHQTNLIINSDIFLSHIYYGQGNLAQALSFAQQAYATAQSLGDAEAQDSAARTLARIELDSAMAAKDPQKRRADWKSFDAHLKVANACDTRLGAPYGHSSTLYLSALAHVARHDNADAITDLRTAISLMEAIRATARSQDAYSESSDVYAYYAAIVKLLLKTGHADQAFDYLSRARSKKLHDSLRLSSIQTHDKAMQTMLQLADSLQTKLGTVRSALSTERAKPNAERDDGKIENLRDLVATTQAEFFKVSAQIKEANPNFEKVLTVKPLELKKAQRSIPADTVLVEYAPLGDQLYVFVVTHDALKIYTPPVKPDALWAAVRANRALMDSAQTDVRNGKALPAVDSDAPLKANLTSLYAMLIAPIEADLKYKSTVAFIPTGLLYYLPLHALAHQTPNGLRFLIEDKRVAYLAAADVLSVVQTRDAGDFGNGMLALGDPTGANLPGAADEVLDIAKIYPGARALTGTGATKQVLLDSANLDRRVLHLATHGVLDGAHPDGSYIQLAGEGEDGKLRMGEVYGLKLDRVDLVTLSACQTALGQKDPDGSEITSLAEAFSSAGTPTVVASLWSVEDESTRQLMEEFYRELAAGKGKADALQGAEVSLLKQPATRNPFYWAPFEVLGDWR